MFSANSRSIVPFMFALEIFETKSRAADIFRRCDTVLRFQKDKSIFKRSGFNNNALLFSL